MSIDEIMDSIRDFSANEETCISRKHLMVRQDIRNIKCSLNLANIQKHSNDQASVAVWVKEAREQEYDPVLIFKPQGESCADLVDESFLLGLQTKLQRDTMIRFGDGGVICIDATHGTTAYDYHYGSGWSW